MTTTRTRSRLTGLLASIALSAIAMTGVSGAAHAGEAGTDDTPAAEESGTEVGATRVDPSEVQADGSAHGCPHGAVCVYPDESWNGGNPTYIFYSYGAHKIYNQYGWHRVYNNQYGRAFASSCKGGNGTDCELPVLPGTYRSESLTLVNSILLFTDQ